MISTENESQLLSRYEVTFTEIVSHHVHCMVFAFLLINPYLEVRKCFFKFVTSGNRLFLFCPPKLRNRAIGSKGVVMILIIDAKMWRK